MRITRTKLDFELDRVNSDLGLENNPIKLNHQASGYGVFTAYGKELNCCMTSQQCYYFLVGLQLGAQHTQKVIERDKYNRYVSEVSAKHLTIH